MHSRAIIARGLLAAIVAVAACTPAAEPEAEPEPPAVTAPSLAGTEWVLATLAGRPPVAGTRVTLEFEARGAGGYAGCNWYGGVYAAGAGGFRVDSLSQTMRGCLAPGVSEQEAAYLAALSRARGARVQGTRLELTDGAGAVLAAFTRRDPLQMDPADLVGSGWRLRGGSAATTPADTTATLHFGDGTARGHAGCRDYTGTYVATGDRIRFTSLAMATTECPRGLAVLRREESFTTGLSESVTWRLAGGTLELTTVDGRTLTFSRER